MVFIPESCIFGPKSHIKKIQVLIRKKKIEADFMEDVVWSINFSIQQQSATDKRFELPNKYGFYHQPFRLSASCVHSSMDGDGVAQVFNEVLANTVSITWTWFNAKTARLDTRSSSPTFTWM